MSQDRDYLLALEMQKKWNDECSDNDIEEILDCSPAKKPSKYRSNQDEDYLNRTSNLVHPQWEVLDPTPDTQAMFRQFDDKFFQKRLRCVTLEWSKRMYSCAGICYSRSNRQGMAVTIRLSEPLLKLRSRKDLVETLLHEMIHAYCFVLGIREGNGGHGPNFKKIMYGINQVAGTNITVYHTFHDEVDVYKQHWWRCNGICQHRTPFYGYVKRSSNRAPGPNDFWWAQHLNSCGGTFMKIKEPEKPPKKTKSAPKTSGTKTAKPQVKSTTGDLRKFFPTATAAKMPTGPVKTNGGGTLLINPKTTTMPTQTTLPKATETKRASGNLVNVVGFKDLDENATPRRPTSETRDFSMTGKGYSLANSTNTTSADREVDRNHLREVWLKKFGNATDNSKKPSKDKCKDDIAGNAKRRRLSTTNDKEEVAFVADEVPKKPDWVMIDEDVMIHEVENNVIAISSSEDEGDSKPITPNCSTPRKALVFSDADERQREIKKEIMEDSTDLSDGLEDDINLIDDDYDDDMLNSSLELADTSLIDDLFGEDILLKEFKRENELVPSCSRYTNDPNNDIITCPICLEKMKRSDLSEHLNGCSGISEKIKPPKPKTRASSPKSKRVSYKKRSHKISPRSKEILRSAGYTDEEIDHIPPTAVSDSASSPSEDDLNLSERRRRMKSVYTTTRPCPMCCQEVDVNLINEHLDECLKD